MGIVLLVLLSSCSGDEYVLEVRLAEGPVGTLGCDGNRRGIESIHIEVLRWRGWDEQVQSHQECVSTSDDASIGAIETPEELFDWFDRRGYIARSIPTDAGAIVRVRGYPIQGCPTADVEPIFCSIPVLQVDDGTVEPVVLDESMKSESEPIAMTVICHPELIPGPPSTCSNTVSARCSDNVCGFNESSDGCEADCGAPPDLCRWYRACAYFRRP